MQYEKDGIINQIRISTKTQLNNKDKIEFFNYLSTNRMLIHLWELSHK